MLPKEKQNQGIFSIDLGVYATAPASTSEESGKETVKQPKMSNN